MVIKSLDYYSIPKRSLDGLVSYDRNIDVRAMFMAKIIDLKKWSKEDQCDFYLRDILCSKFDIKEPSDKKCRDIENIIYRLKGVIQFCKLKNLRVGKFKFEMKRFEGELMLLNSDYLSKIEEYNDRVSAVVRDFKDQYPNWREDIDKW